MEQDVNEVGLKVGDGILSCEVFLSVLTGGGQGTGDSFHLARCTCVDYYDDAARSS